MYSLVATLLIELGGFLEVDDTVLRHLASAVDDDVTSGRRRSLLVVPAQIRVHHHVALRRDVILRIRQITDIRVTFERIHTCTFDIHKSLPLLSTQDTKEFETKHILLTLRHAHALL